MLSFSLCLVSVEYKTAFQGTRETVEKKRHRGDQETRKTAELGETVRCMHFTIQYTF